MTRTNLHSLVVNHKVSVNVNGYRKYFGKLYNLFKGYAPEHITALYNLIVVQSCNMVSIGFFEALLYFCKPLISYEGIPRFFLWHAPWDYILFGWAPQVWQRSAGLHIYSNTTATVKNAHALPPWIKKMTLL